jgi:hypothetical protein
MTMLTRIATEFDTDGILHLQSKNLYTNLSTEERAHGFVMTPFTAEKVQLLITQTGAFVAEKEGNIVGYALAGTWEFFSAWDIFPFMISRFPALNFQGMEISTENSFQYGPVCIDRELRGSGVFPQLFETMRNSFASRFSIGVTFINKLNPRSLKAHAHKLDLEIIDEFEFKENSYYGLAFLTKS